MVYSTPQMIFHLIPIICSLLQAKKTQIFNCFDSSTDVNRYKDTKKIYITVSSMHEATCVFPHGIKISLTLDGIGNFKPYSYA